MDFSDNWFSTIIDSSVITWNLPELIQDPEILQKLKEFESLDYPKSSSPKPILKVDVEKANSTSSEVKQNLLIYHSILFRLED